MSARRWYDPRRLAWRAVFLAVGYWALVAAVGVALDARWPQTGFIWRNFLTLGAFVTFLNVKWFLMWLRTRHFGRLGASMIAANLGFAVLYAFGQAAILWPQIADVRLPSGGIIEGWDWETRLWLGPWWGWHDVRFTLLEAIRWPVLVILAWGAVELVRVPDPDPDDDGSDAYLWGLIEAKDRELDGLRAELARLRPKGETPL